MAIQSQRLNPAYEAALSKSMDAMLAEYEDVLLKGDLSHTEASLSPTGEQGEVLAGGNDDKGGLKAGSNPQGGGHPHGDPLSATNDPIAYDRIPPAKNQPIASPPGDGMGKDPVAQERLVPAPKPSVGSEAGDGMGNDPIAYPGDKGKPAPGIAKAEGPRKDVAPPGFKGKDEDKSEGAEDEDSEDESQDEGDEHEAKHPGSDEDEGSEEGHEGDVEDSDEHGEHGDDEGEDEDPRFAAAIEKGIYKFMEKIGMGGEYAKSLAEDAEGEVESLRKSIQEDVHAKELEPLRKSIDDRFAKVEGDLGKIGDLLKTLSESIERIAKAPVAKPRAVNGYSPSLRKSEAPEGEKLSKSELVEKAFEAIRTGKTTDRALVAKVETAPNAEAAYQMLQRAGVVIN